MVKRGEKWSFAEDKKLAELRRGSQARESAAEKGHCLGALAIPRAVALFSGPMISGSTPCSHHSLSQFFLLSKSPHSLSAEFLRFN